MKTNTIQLPRPAWRPLVAATVFVSGLASALWSADGGSKPAWLSDLSVTAAQSYNSNVYGAEVSVPGFDPVADVAAEHPEEAARLQRLCRGLYETARYMIRHNPPAGQAPPG